jgi:uncharacterized oligopeptide transporter (OPT) family protein
METAYNHYRRREVEAENNELKQAVKENTKTIGFLIAAVLINGTALVCLIVYVVKNAH